jgi:hypothetical protein
MTKALIQIHNFNRNWLLKAWVTHVRICVRIAVRFRARFVRKQNREPIIFLLAIAMVDLHISAKKSKNELA